MDGIRLGQIHANPECATPAEIQSLVEMSDSYRRSLLQKSLRDEFAMAAVPALLRAFGEGQADLEPSDLDDGADLTRAERVTRGIARWAYRVADAMMAAR